MKQFLKRMTLFILTSILLMNSFSLNASAEEEVTSHRVYCKVYDAEGVLTQEGYLPLSEQEYLSRAYDYDTFVIQSGGTIYLGESNGPIYVGSEKTVHFRFSLNRNINAKVRILNSDHVTIYKNWYGLTGGLSTSARVPGGSYIYGSIGNDSSSAVTVNWATIEF